MTRGGPEQAAEPPDPVAFHRELKALTTPRACGQAFSRAIAPLGFDTFACGELYPAVPERNAFFVIEWPARWTRFYRDSGLLERDPIVSELSARAGPFSWSELRADRKFSKVGRAAIELAATFGWNEGLVVPLPQGGGRFGLVSMAGSTPIDPATRDLLALFATCLHAHVRTLVARGGCALPPAGLTPREVECVGLIARGRSDRAIADTLGIATSTAHEFAEKAKRKLHARSRAEMIAVAVSLAIVEA